MHLWEQSKGHPLFLIETVRSRDRGNVEMKGTAGAAAPGAAILPRPCGIPKKIHAVISGRLRPLSSSARKVADWAAVMGRAFSYAQLRHAIDADEEDLVTALDELWQRRILREQDNGYDFSHDYIREVAYVEIPIARRRMLHRSVARALVATSEDVINAMAAQIASHFERGGDGANAAAYVQLAAASAKQLNAIHDEITYLRKGLALLDTLPADDARDRRELSLQTWLGATLLETKGQTPEAEQAYQRALDLCHRLNERTDLFPVLAGLQFYFQARTQHIRALNSAKQMLELANEQENGSMQMEAHGALGISFYYTGCFAESQTHLERSVALYERHGSEHNSVRTRYRGSGLAYRAFLGRVLWLRGYPDQALRMSEETVRLGMQSGDPGAQVVALAYSNRVFQRCRRVERVRAIAGDLLRLANQHGIAHRAGMAIFLQGWTLAVPVLSMRQSSRIRHCHSPQLWLSNAGAVRVGKKMLRG